MSPNKALGPDDIPVLVLQKLWPVIHMPLFTLFTACLRIGYYPAKWCDASTLILRKPSRPDYAAPNAYCPIALLCTMGKLLEAIIARRISSLADHFNLLPNTTTLGSFNISQTAGPAAKVIHFTAPPYSPSLIYPPTYSCISDVSGSQMTFFKTTVGPWP
jgi:hypothetical protein